MRLWILLALCGLLGGCSTWGVRESRVVLPDGREIRMYIQADASAKYKDANVELSVDNRGREPVLQTVLTAPLVGLSKLAETAISK